MVIQQPVDHLTFLKQILYQAAKSRDVTRVVLLGAPKINCEEVGKQIAENTGQMLITESSIMKCFAKVSISTVLTDVGTIRLLCYYKFDSIILDKNKKQINPRASCKESGLFSKDRKRFQQRLDNGR